MKIKYLVLFFVILAMAGCTQAPVSEQQTNTPAPTVPVSTPVITQAETTNKVTAVVTQAEETNTIEAKCVRNSDQTQLLVNSPLGYCMQYPVGYDIALLNDGGIMLMKRSPLNAEDPNVFINVEPADGRTVEQVADKLIADYTVPGLDVTRTPLVIDKEQAIRVDGLTGQDPNRHVVVIYNDRLYHMTFNLMQNTPDVSARAESLYSTVIQSFSFHPETNLCSDCPSYSETP